MIKPPVRRRKSIPVFSFPAGGPAAPPSGSENAPLQALIFDSQYDSYRGVIVYMRIMEGCIQPGQTVKIPTGIRVRMEEGWVLACFPRSGLGFKYRLQLDNTVGIIDSDYWQSDNEGHIFCKLTNDSKQGKTLELEAGTGFMQGIFLPFGITLDDSVSDRRNGGFGSTSAKSAK